MSIRIGHVHLEVADAERSAAFYGELLGFETRESVGGFRFLSGGPAHHELALQTSASPGLYHSAFEVDSEQELAAVAARLRDAGVRYSAVDHGISHALYFRDPDGLGVEVYLDRRGAAGCRAWDGRSRALDL
ncbi:MAG: biphenyl-2,3-diol 1,2-dioxygenase [Acidobacteria bacterium]|nr:MAG: biphenyl-2,3-diol 1,2-dioxygenase [Acidobacteriota bacterium]REK09601.1 MAG: biphenyl-2,3-diol 1,2-dioxygenase [Acidobacteriota bacterium]